MNDTCGHAIEEHGNDPEHPGSSACDYQQDCGCIAYEAEEHDGSNSDGEADG